MSNQEKNQLAVTQPQSMTAETLIAQAINKKVPVETMEKLLAMRRELKAEWAKEEFDKAMSNFQADCPTIQKTKAVETSAGKVAYKYAPIESIVEQVKFYLKDNGFSYSTNMKLLETGVTVIVKVTHKDGHSEITEMTVPFGNKTNVMSQTQVVAAAQTFAKRYAFCNAFGILTGDEDDDANSVPKEGKSVQIHASASSGKPATTKQVVLIAKLLDQKGFSKEDLKMKYKVSSLEELSSETASTIIGNLMKLNNIQADIAEEAEIVDEIDEGLSKKQFADEHNADVQESEPVGHVEQDEAVVGPH